MNWQQGRQQHWRTQAVTLALGVQLRQLLGQQLFSFQALPGRVTVVLERRQ